MAKRKQPKKFLVRDKRALLDTLIALDEEQERINTASQRLSDREEKLRTRRRRVATRLANGLYSRKESVSTPILVGNKVVQLERTTGWDMTHDARVRKVTKA